MFIKDLNAMAQEVKSIAITEANLRARCNALDKEYHRKWYLFTRSISEYLHFTLYKCIRDCGFGCVTDKYTSHDSYGDPKNPSLTIYLTKPTDNWNDWENKSSISWRDRDNGGYYINARHAIYIAHHDEHDNITYKAVIIAYAHYDAETGDIKFICGSNDVHFDDDAYYKPIFLNSVYKRCNPKDMYLVSFKKQPLVDESEFVNDVKKIISEKVV